MVCVDVGLKYNQLRCLVSRGVEVLRVPFDFSFPQLAGRDYDGLFVSVSTEVVSRFVEAGTDTR